MLVVVRDTMIHIGDQNLPGYPEVSGNAIIDRFDVPNFSGDVEISIGAFGSQANNSVNLNKDYHLGPLAQGNADEFTITKFTVPADRFYSDENEERENEIDILAGSFRDGSTDDLIVGPIYITGELS